MFFIPCRKAGQGIVATVTDTAVKSTFGGISKTVMTKVAIALCSLIVVGGAVTTAIVWSQSGKNPQSAIKTVTNLDTEEIEEIIEAEDLQVDEDGELTDKDGNKVAITEDGKVELKTEDNTEPENSSAKTEKTENKNQNVKATEAAKPSNTNTNKGTGSGSTQKATEAPKATQPATQKVTEAPKATQPKATQPATQKPTQAPAPKPTQPATQKPTQAPTQAPTQPPTEYKAKMICNDCGVDMADWSDKDVAKHLGDHLRNGGCGSYHVE